MVEGDILSPHGTLRAYTVFLTDRASARLPDGAPSSVSDGPHLAEVRMLRVCLSQGGALRAYPELLTAESLRLSLMVAY